MYLPKATTTQWSGATPTWKDNEIRGTDFVFFTPGTDATRVELCLFDQATGAHECDHLDFDPKNKEEVLAQDGKTVLGYKWNGFVEGDKAKPGKMYGFRVHGHGFDPNKLLLDPEYKAVAGDPDMRDPRPPGQNNGDIMPKAVVTNWRALPKGHTRLLGATLDEKRGGTNFAFYTSKDAEGVELCLFDQATGAKETRRIELDAKEPVMGNDGKTLIGYIWNGYAADVHEGQMYGFRVHGPYDPEKRQYYNPYKLLVDPCAKAVTHEIHDWGEVKENPVTHEQEYVCDQRFFHHDFNRRVNNRPAMNCEDNAEVMPKARVVNVQALYDKARADGVQRGALYPHADTNLLEMHVKGATMKLRPDCFPPEMAEQVDVADHERGTYKALASNFFVDWVKDMGYTTLEWMPIASFGTDTGLLERTKGTLKNYWGYMTAVPMAPHTGYAATAKPEEEVVDTIHKLKQEGIEVIMDVVPNHTLEGGDYGPVVNLRGMDPYLYLTTDYTGTGNTRDFAHPINRRIFLESLRHWQEMGVSGFRIDLATVLGREYGGNFNPDSQMMKELRQDYGAENGLHNVKFYGEPWDLGPNGVQRGRLAHYPQDNVGLFSNHIAEWDGEARDVLQSLLNSKVNPTRGTIIHHLAGSSRTHPHTPQTSVKKAFSHDGPTAQDAATREVKNNEANCEGGRDGNEMPGTNWGPEAGRVQRFLMAMLGLSQGVPMTCLGHERGKSQGGNTNAYCQDNDITYIPWGNDITPEGKALMEFQKQVNRFRGDHSSLRRASHFSGEEDKASELVFGGEGKTMKDVTWLHPDGTEIQGGKDGPMDHAGGFAMLLSGDPGNSKPTEKHFTRLVKRTQRDNPLLVLVNPTMEHNIEFTLPNVPGVKWKSAINTRDPDQVDKEIPAGQKMKVDWRSLVVFEGQRYLERGTQARAAAR